MTPMSNVHGIKRLKRKLDYLLSNFAFNLSSRRYIAGRRSIATDSPRSRRGRAVQLEPMKPMFKGPGPWLLKV